MFVCGLQVALLRWLSSQCEADRKLLAAVTGIQVGRELLNRITGQDQVDAYKVCVRLQEAAEVRCFPNKQRSWCWFWFYSEGMHPEHRGFPPEEPAGLAGPDQRRGGEERSSVRSAGQSPGIRSLTLTGGEFFTPRVQTTSFLSWTSRPFTIKASFVSPFFYSLNLKTFLSFTLNQEINRSCSLITGFILFVFSNIVLYQ